MICAWKAINQGTGDASVISDILHSQFDEPTSEPVARKQTVTATATLPDEKDLTPHMNAMLRSLGGLSAAQKGLLLIHNHLPGAFNFLKHVRLDPTAVFLLSVAQALPILAVYFLTQWSGMIHGDYELALELSAIALKRTKDKNNCDEALASFARGHAHEEDSSPLYLRAIKILAQTPHAAYSLAILNPTCRRSSGLMGALDSEPE
ncbi:hypothetical protein OQA88_5931 [Cercophora sp. LCS_1]